MTHTCLIELFTEELPPKALPKLSQALCASFEKQLHAAQLNFATIKPFASPRRLALIIEELDGTQAEQKIARKGPALKAAYDSEGLPTKAALGFATSCGVTVTELTTLKTEQGEWLYFESMQEGQETKALLPNMLQTALKQLPIPKPMHWGAHSATFIRPVHNVVIMLDDDVVATKFFEHETNNLIYGHRFLAPDAVELTHADDYEHTLHKKGYVIADFNERKEKIVEQINTLIKKQFDEGVFADIDPELLDEVTALVEWPHALLAKFDESFLSAPQEALVSSMQQHQKCFPIKDPDGKLLPFFITISNIDSKDEQAVISGNERVMHARLSDAIFFFNADCKQALADYIPRLQQITYQKKLGSVYDKVTRIKAIAAHIAQQNNVNEADTLRAAELAKADLVTQMVGEFPELQGIMGKYYALIDNEKEAVATAIAEHYMPRFATDDLPWTDVGMTLAIADRIDTLVGIFAIGSIPTGDKDPFGLRRAALGMLHIIIDKDLNLDINDLINIATAQLPSELTFSDELKATLHNFINERFKTLALAHEVTVDVFNAVMSLNNTKPNDAIKRMHAVQQFKTLDNSQALAAANKRVSNILAKSDQQVSGNIDSALLTEEAEQKLASAINDMEEKVNADVTDENYQDALMLLAQLHDVVNEFFDNVMVMTDDTKLRDNRIKLLHKLRSLFLLIADIALLQ